MPPGHIHHLWNIVGSFCSIFHHGRARRLPQFQGVLTQLIATEAANDPLQPVPRRRYRLCDECRHHFLQASVKRHFCAQAAKIPCSRCQESCFDEAHRKFMNRVMLFRVFYLVISGNWGPVLAHIFLPKQPRP